MSKLNRARKREIRAATREAVACFVREMDSKCFEGIGENEEEIAYVKREVEEIAGRINYQKPEGEAE